MRFALVLGSGGARGYAHIGVIDELKERVPIWKKETTPQGDSWVTPHP